MLQHFSPPLCVNSVRKKWKSASLCALLIDISIKLIATVEESKYIHNRTGDIFKNVTHVHVVTLYWSANKAIKYFQVANGILKFN